MVDLASRASSMADKRRLLAMAEAWLDLADRAHSSMHRHASRLDERAVFHIELLRGNCPGLRLAMMDAMLGIGIAGT
jgi:hypothetical protein